MTAQERLEEVLKEMDVLIKVARKGVLGDATLEEKVVISGCKADLLEARRLIIGRHSDIKAAEEYGKNVATCPECGSIG